MDLYQQFYDLYKVQQDTQKHLWDKLNSYLDYGGNKLVIEQRLNSICELHEHLPESNIKLLELQKYVENKIGILPVRAQEAMRKDVNNLKFDQEKLTGTISDIKSALENRLKQWNDYETILEKLLTWLAESEMALRNYEVMPTLEDKQEQLEKYQVIV